MGQSLGVFRRINSLQYIRVLCALGVVLYHAEAAANQYFHSPHPLSLFLWGKMGVPMFFCLSGFVICYAGFLKPRPAGEFIFSRIARIYPAYLLVAAVFMASLLLFPDGVFNDVPSLSIENTVRTLLFDFGHTGGYVYVGWTLFYEMCFYLCFACVASRFPDIAKKRSFTIAISLLLLILTYFDQFPVAYFVVGICCYLIVVNPANESRRSVFYLLPVFAMLSGLAAHPIAVFCGALMTGLLVLERQKAQLFGSKILLLLADSSYSIYLVQVLSISASIKLVHFLAADLPVDSDRGIYLVVYVVSVVFASLVTFVSGVAMRRIVEKPSFAFLYSMRDRLAALPLKAVHGI